MERMKYDIKWLNNEFKRIGVPDRFRFPLKEIFENDYAIILSMRQDAGKTTTALILGLLLNVKYGYPIEYIRNDDNQIRRRAVETLFDVILKFDYIKKIYNGRWNSVQYHYMQKKFYLCNRNEDGSIEEESPNPICMIHSNEEWATLKSSYNSPESNYIIFDEALDSQRMTSLLWAELMNNISTIGRVLEPERAAKAHVVILGNNTDRYAWLFQDFCISDLIPDLKYGTMIKFKTEKGTTGICTLMAQSEIQKERLKENKIPFFGFNTQKAAQFIGSSEWSAKEYQHPDFHIDFDNCLFRRMYIKHRQRYIQLNLMYDEDHKKYIFAHFASEPLKKDNIILTLNPQEYCEFYGLCEYEDNRKVYEVVKKFFRLRKENRWYYESNLIGEIVDDYIKNIQ